MPPELERQSEFRPKSFPKHGSRLPVIVSLVVIGILSGIIARNRIIHELDHPLGPTLPPFSAPTPEITADSLPAIASVYASTQPPSTTSSPELEPTSTPKAPLCNGPAQLLILVIGADTRPDDDPSVKGLADVIRITRVDFVTPSVTVLAFPRDLWVEVPGLDSYQGERLVNYFGYPIMPGGDVLVLPGYHARINSAYFYGNLYDMPGRGPGILAHTLYYNFGIPVDRYVDVKMASVTKAVDAVGGIDLYMPDEIGGFPAGWNHLDGAEALRYARMRKMDNDWNRINRQTQVVRALHEKVLQPQLLPALPVIAESLLEDAVTDLSRSEIASLICLTSKIDSETVVSYVVTREMITETHTTGNAYVMLPHMDEIQQLVTAFLIGTPNN